MRPLLKEIIMDNQADKYIVDLIADLAQRAKRWSTSDEDRSRYIKEIAKLRDSMNPTIIQQKD